MAGLLRKKASELAPSDMFERMEQMFEDWARTFPFGPGFGREWMPQRLIRVDEYRENGTLVIRAELPGIDPDKDVELTITDGTLHLSAERREEERREEKGYLRKELRFGSVERTLPIPDGVKVEDVTATYKDGILEIRIPAPAAEPTAKVPITKG